MYMTIVTDIKPKVYTFVDGKAGNQTVLMVNMGTKWAHAVR